MFGLAEAFFSIMKRKEQENLQTIKGKTYSVKEKMEEILSTLHKDKFLDFLDFFNEQESMEEAVLSFFCLLELIKARIVIAIQENLFRSIKVWLRKENC